MRLSLHRYLTFLMLGAAVAVLDGCSALGGGAKPSVYQQESFDSDTYSRSFQASVANTCEAARRALLSQGYVIDKASAAEVNGRKNFQPQPEVHVQLEFHVVCAPSSRSGNSAIAFVSALQDRYTLRKSNNSASVGVSAIGSLSLPVSSSDDSLVKVASETIPAGPFYDRFFTLVDRFLAQHAEEEGADSADAQGSKP